MIYTVLFGHFDSISVQVGQTLKRGDRIGIEGDTGIAFGKHVHIAVARGGGRNLEDMRLGALRATNSGVDQGQTQAMVTKSLYRVPFSVTTEFNDPEYQREFGYSHPAIDVSASQKGEYVYWPIAQTGTVTHVYYGDVAYGNAVIAEFQVGGSNPNTTGEYRIQSGDTLTSIAAKFSTTVEKLLSLNPQITNKNLIYTGDILKVPTSSSVFRVGDRVKIIYTGNANSLGSGEKAYGIGWYRYVTAVYKGRAFPYQVGNKGKTDGTNTVGYYKPCALERA